MSPLKRLPTRAALLLVALMVAGMGLSALPALAAAGIDPGVDGAVHFVTGEGAITPYLMNQQIEGLYNGSPGCTLGGYPTQTVSGIGFGNGFCVTATPATVVGGNYQHDVVSRAFQITSGNGIGMLLHTTYPGFQTPTVTPGHSVDIADTNRSPVTATGIPSTPVDPTGTTWASLAKDAQTLWTFATSTGQSARTAPTPTQAQLQQVFFGTVSGSSLVCSNAAGGNDTWATLDGNPADTAPIVLYGPATTAGTFVDVTRYLLAGYTGPVPTDGMNHCIDQLYGSSHIITVNNAGPIQAGNSGNPLTDPFNALWWASNGVLTTYPNLRQTGNPVTSIDGVTLSNLTTACYNGFSGTTACTAWPIQQYFENVMLSPAFTAATVLNTGTATVTSPPNDPPGAGQLGAVRAYMDFACATAGNSITNPTTGDNYRTDIASAITVQGFQAIPTNQSAVTPNPGTGVSDRCFWQPL